MWTGNRPDAVAAFYTDDLFYCDPAVPEGLKGKKAFLAYLEPLLAANPGWVWTHERATPLEDGFLNHWILEWPIGGRIMVGRGVCTVQLRHGLIYQNEVFFDRLQFA